MTENGHRWRTNGSGEPSVSAPSRLRGAKRLRSLLGRTSPAPPPSFTAAVLEDLADPVVTCDAGRTVMFNRRAREVHGFPAGPVPVEEWTDRYRLYNHDGSRARTEDLPLVRALRGDDVRDVELESRPREGGRRLMRVSGGPVRDAHGDIQGAALVMHDITERVANEARLRLQSEVAANIADSVALVRAADGEIVYMNESWARMFGYERDELVGQPISVLNVATEQPPEERAREIIGALGRDGIWCGEVHSVRKDGTWFWCAATISTFEHPDHGSVWVVVQVDTTERRVMENALRAEEERFRTVFEESPVGIALVGTDQRLTDVNHAFCDIVGHRPDELVGRPLAAITHPDDLELNTELAGKVFNGDLPRYLVAKRYLSERGDVVPVAVTASMVHGPDGRALYGITVVEEVAKS